MIVGETETLLARNTGSSLHHDNFLFFGKKKKLTPEEKEAKKKRRRQFWKDLDQTLQADGMDKSVNNLVGAFKSPPANDSTEADYEVGLQGQDKGKDKKGIPTGMYVVGAAVVVGIVVYAISHVNKAKQLKISSGQ